MRNLIKILFFSVILLGIINFFNTTFVNFEKFSMLKYPILLSALVVNIYYISKSESSSIVINNNVKIVFILVFIILIFGTISSYDSTSSLFRGILAFIIILLIITYIQIFSSNDFLLLLFKNIYSIGILLIIVTNILLIFRTFDVYYLGNMRGLFKNANIFATLLAISIIPSILLFLFKSSSFKSKILNLIFLINAIILLILTGSRSALMTLIIILLIIYYYKFFIWNKKRIKNLTMISIVLVLISTSILTNQTYLNMINRYFIKYDHLVTSTSNIESLNTRAGLWDDRIQGILKEPLTGWGYGVNSKDFIIKNHSYNFEYGVTEKGNTILSIFEEFGLLIGLLIIFLITILVYKFVSNLNNVLNTHNTIYLITCSSIIGSLCHVNFESWLLYFGNTNAFLFWCFFIALSYGNKINNERNINI